VRRVSLLPLLTLSQEPCPIPMSDATKTPNVLPTASKTRRYCFTINNYSVLPTFDETKLCYLVFGKEIAPTTATPHLQGYLELKTPQRISYLHKIPGFESAHFLPARGTAQQNRDYCTKGGDYNEFGNPGPGSGARTDLSHCRDILAENPNTHGLKRILLEHPGDFIRYHSGLEKAAKLLKPDLAPVEAELRPWQLELMDLIEEHSPHPRQIHFYIDSEGAAGKSFMARYIYSLRPADTLVLSNAKHDRMFHNYSGQSRIIFDMNRSLDDDHDNMPYAVMENIKNGYKPPGMYGSPPEFFKPPHVIVFCNSAPKMNALSQDRYDLHYLSSTNAY